MKSWKVFYFIFPIFIFGCIGKPPVQYTSTVKVESTINYTDKKILMEKAIRNTFPYEDISGSCVEFNITSKNIPTMRNVYNSGKSVKKMADVCFTINNDLITRNHHIYNNNIYLEEWFERIISNQSKVEKEYLTLANIFVKQKKELEIDQQKFIAKKDSIDFTCIDETGAVPKSIIEQFKNSIKLKAEYPKIYVNFQRQINRYYLNISGNIPLNPNYSNYNDHINLRIVDYKVNPIPDTFFAEDSSISITVSYDLNREDISKITIENKTSGFISVDAIAGYFDGAVINNMLKNPIQLAPKSIMAIDSYNLTPFLPRGYDQYFYKASVRYGFSANYKLSNSVSHRSIYKVDSLVAK